MYTKTAFAVAALALAVISGCTNDTASVTQNSSAVKTEAASQVVATPISSENKPVALSKKEALVSVGTTHSYNLSPFFVGQTVQVAPEYLYEHKIYYTHFIQTNENKVSSTIYRYTPGSNTNEVIQTVDQTIGSLTGVSHYLFWVASAPAENGIAWTIHSFNLKNGKQDLLDRGVSRFDASIPVLVASTTRLSWLIHDATAKKTTTLMKSFDVAADTIIVHEQYDLTKRKQDGILPFDFRSGDAGRLIHTRTFKDGTKTSRLASDDGRFQRPIDGLIDFEYGADYVATGEEGHAAFLPLDSKQSDFTYELSDRHSTVASFRFLSRDRVIFRENTSQLLYADLTRGTVAPLTEMEDTMSKPIYVNRTIAYAVSDGQDVTFHVIDVTP
ncbi:MULTISPECIES: hypothetical protein [unclassified Exiguobacterium]|uniref:hypothetical protein n=1 Tax=unclassified Exiguobacterium TaxID=2644629 RepID=UPI001BE77320|nr:MULTISPECIES: hypothetical protein [unclassified Exiguobacterium]